MTPEEFKNLKRGDKVIIPITDKETVLIVAGKDEDKIILCFTKDKWGMKIEGWIDSFNLPESDRGKWADIFTFKYLKITKEQSEYQKSGFEFL